VKSFINKKAMTLVELVISVAITVVVVLIVTVFLTDSINSISSSTISTKTYSELLDFKETLNWYTKTGYPDFSIFSWAFDVLEIKNTSDTDAYIYWVVDLNTNKLQKNHFYGENVLWYRRLSISEITTINSNSWTLYDLEFQSDKLFLNTRVYDFKLASYNTDSIIDLYIKLILRKDTGNFWEKIEDIAFPSSDLIDFNLVF